MRRILGLNDKGDDVALIQETLNDVMPFADPVQQEPNVGTLWEQANSRVGSDYAGRYPLSGSFDIYTWGRVQSWSDLSYDWAYGGMAAARKLKGREPLAKLTGDLEPHHYKPLKADGGYGPKTEAVVKQFQRLNGLPPDGIFGPATWESMVPTAFYTLCAPIPDNTPKKRAQVWVKPDDKAGKPGGVCYAPIPAKPGDQPPGPGYERKSVDEDDDADKSAIKVEVQTGLQSGDVGTFVLGQIIFVRPRDPKDKSLPKVFASAHDEYAGGVQVNEDKNVQLFVSLTRADIFKYKLPFDIIEFSVDLLVQPYVQIKTATSSQNAVGIQAGVTGNLNFTPLIERILGKDTSLDAAIFGTVARQYEYDFGSGNNDPFKISLPWVLGFKASWKFK